MESLQEAPATPYAISVETVQSEVQSRPEKRKAHHYHDGSPVPYDEIRARYIKGERLTPLSEEYGVKMGTLASRCSRERWDDLREKANAAMQGSIKRAANGVAIGAAKRAEQFISDVLTDVKMFRTKFSSLSANVEQVKDITQLTEAWKNVIGVGSAVLGIGQGEAQGKNPLVAINMAHSPTPEQAKPVAGFTVDIASAPASQDQPS